jgi:large subunit ribosomal protein L13
MTTYSAKPSEIERKWYVVDATDLVLGRLASRVSMILRGKHKPLFSTNIDCGDHVIILNAGKIHLTGNKYEDKKYFWHTGHPGGIKERTVRKVIEGAHPKRVLEKAVERMIARSPLGRAQMLKLHVYAGSEHPHAGQKPEPLVFAEVNRKNKKSESEAA